VARTICIGLPPVNRKTPPLRRFSGAGNGKIANEAHNRNGRKGAGPRAMGAGHAAPASLPRSGGRPAFVEAGEGRSRAGADPVGLRRSRRTSGYCAACAVASLCRNHEIFFM
jgi:hypothetical protein